MLAACLLGDAFMQRVADALLPIYREARTVLPSFVLEAFGMVVTLAVLFVSLFSVGVLGGISARTLVEWYPRFGRVIP